MYILDCVQYGQDYAYFMGVTILRKKVKPLFNKSSCSVDNVVLCDNEPTLHKSNEVPI